MAKKNVSAEGAQDSAAILKELEMIRQLLMLLVVKIGATTGEIGVAFGLTQQRASQLIAAGKIKKIKFNTVAEDEES
jgi:hypothetical protein